MSRPKPDRRPEEKDDPHRMTRQEARSVWKNVLMKRLNPKGIIKVVKREE